MASSISRVVVFLINIIAARILRPELFGQFSTVRTSMAMLGNLIYGALGLSVTKKIAENHNNPKAIPSLIISPYVINFIILFFISVFTFTFSSWIVNTFFLSSKNIKTALYIGLLLLSGSSISLITQSILIGFEKFRLIAILSIFTAILTLPISLYLIYQFDFYGAFFGIIIYFFIDFLTKGISLFFINNKIVFNIKFHEIIKTINAFISFSFPLFLALLVSSGSFWYAKIIIINSTKTFSQIGIFDAAFQLFSIIMIITGSTTSVALPMLSRAEGNKNRRELNRVFYYNLLINIIIVSFVSFIFIVFANKIMLLYGTEYVKGSNILIILSISSIFYTISSVFNKYMLAKNKVWLVLLATITGASSMFIILKIMLSYQAFGLACSFLGYHIFSLFVYISFFLITHGSSRIIAIQNKLKK